MEHQKFKKTKNPERHLKVEHQKTKNPERHLKVEHQKSKKTKNPERHLKVEHQKTKNPERHLKVEHQKTKNPERHLYSFLNMASHQQPSMKSIELDEYCGSVSLIKSSAIHGVGKIIN
jgi:hypothetical protein